MSAPARLRAFAAHLVEARIAEPHDKRDPLRHQSRDKRHVAAEPVELGDDDGAFELARFVQRYAQLGPQLQGVDALARLDLDMLARELELLGFGEAPDRLPLSVEAKSRTALSVGRDAQVGDQFSVSPFSLTILVSRF